MEFADGGTLDNFIKTEEQKTYFLNEELRSILFVFGIGMKAINEKLVTSWCKTR